MKTPEQIVETYSQGWEAMEWLARHAKNKTCRECADYHRRVEQGGKAPELVTLRCGLAQIQHRKYMAVKHMRLELTDAMECFVGNGETKCSGPAEWILAQRKPSGHQVGSVRQRGELVSYQIGCHLHVWEAEAKAVVQGHAGVFYAERLDTLTPEEARLMA